MGHIGGSRSGRLRPGGSNLRRERRERSLDTSLTEGVGKVLGRDRLALSHPEEMGQCGNRDIGIGLDVGRGGVSGGSLASHLFRR